MNSVSPPPLLFLSFAVVFLVSCSSGGGGARSAASESTPEQPAEMMPQEQEQEATQEEEDTFVTFPNVPVIPVSPEETNKAKVEYDELPLYDGYLWSRDVYFDTHGNLAARRDLGCDAAFCESTSTNQWARRFASDPEAVYDAERDEWGTYITVRGLDVYKYRFFAHGFRYRCTGNNVHCVSEGRFGSGGTFWQDAVAYGRINIHKPELDDQSRLVYNGKAIIAPDTEVNDGPQTISTGTSKVQLIHITGQNYTVDVDLKFPTLNPGSQHPGGLTLDWNNIPLDGGRFDRHLDNNDVCSNTFGCDEHRQFVEGALFGPNYEEAGGIFRTDVRGSNDTYHGSFGGTRDDLTDE